MGNEAMANLIMYVVIFIISSEIVHDSSPNSILVNIQARTKIAREAGLCEKITRDRWQDLRVNVRRVGSSYQ